jgi:hypothetical protein
MLFHLITITILLVLFTYISYKSYEGFNATYSQSKYSPTTDIAIPKAPDGTSYISPDKDGKCPGGFERDQSDVNSLCHAPCKMADAKFYVPDGKPVGCSVLDMNYTMENEQYQFAKDKKTNIVSPQKDGSCPKNFKLDLKSGLCHTLCANGNQTFFGALGCMILNKDFSQTKYGSTDSPYPIAEDGNTRYVSPTPNAECPEGFSLDFESGLCYTTCTDSKTFNGKKSGTGIIGCQ